MLKFILRKNPHNERWGDMKLYLELQVRKDFCSRFLLVFSNLYLELPSSQTTLYLKLHSSRTTLYLEPPSISNNLLSRTTFISNLPLLRNTYCLDHQIIGSVRLFFCYFISNFVLNFEHESNHKINHIKTYLVTLAQAIQIRL